MSSAQTSSADLSQILQGMRDQLARIEARLTLQPALKSSPWLPLSEAAPALHYPSTKALRTAIDRGRIPPQFISNTSDNNKRRRLLVNVEAYASHLRNNRRH